MHKLYKQSGADLLYWEVWQDGRKIVVHEGTVGTRGNTKTHTVLPFTSADRRIESLTAAKRDRGYEPVADDDHQTLIVQLPMTGNVDTDLDRRNDILGQLDQLIGWIGAGHVDGADYGSGTMNIYVLTVSAKATSPAIIEWVQKNLQSDNATLAVEPQDEDQSPHVIWPSNFTGQFSY